MLDVVYSERWPAPNTQGTFRLVVALLYQFFVVYVCNIPHCAQIVNRFRGESRDSISFFHPGGGAPLAFPQGRRKAPWDFITVKGTRYVFAGSVCRSVMAIPHPPRSARHLSPGGRQGAAAPVRNWKLDKKIPAGKFSLTGWDLNCLAVIYIFHWASQLASSVSARLSRHRSWFTVQATSAPWYRTR